MVPKILIMSGYGINCETESAHAFEIAGGVSEVVHINDLIAKKKDMSDYDIIMFPGGFSYGDDTGSGNAFANKLKNNLWAELQQFIADKKLILGICNGFQIMTNLGLFATNEKEYGKRIHALDANDSNRYECLWVHLQNHSKKCVFTKGVDKIHVPIAHGEGKFTCDEETYKLFKKNDQIVFTYVDEEGKSASNTYPTNPNGSLHDVAGICDISGRLFGMMPHPERALYSTNEPEFHLKKAIAKSYKLKLKKFMVKNKRLFENAIKYVMEKKV